MNCQDFIPCTEKLECIDMNEEMPEHVERKSSIIVTDSTMEQLVILTTSTLALPPPPSTIPRDLWTNKVEFLLSVIGYVVDLGKEKLRIEIKRDDNHFLFI